METKYSDHSGEDLTEPDDDLIHTHNVDGLVDIFMDKWDMSKTPFVYRKVVSF